MIAVLVGVGIVAWIGIALLLTRWNAGLPWDEQAEWLRPSNALSWPFVVSAIILVAPLVIVIWPLLQLFEWAGRSRR